MAKTCKGYCIMRKYLVMCVILVLSAGCTIPSKFINFAGVEFTILSVSYHTHKHEDKTIVKRSVGDVKYGDDVDDNGTEDNPFIDKE
jgi:hypothetical protein